MMPTVDLTGTVSEATMRERDLIPVFMDVLEGFDPSTAETMQEELDSILRGRSWNKFESTATDDEWDALGFFLNESLWDAMDTLAPDGYYFGAHPGDGADYGYWRVDDDDEEDDENEEEKDM